MENSQVFNDCLINYQAENKSLIKYNNQIYSASQQKPWETKLEWDTTKVKDIRDIATPASFGNIVYFLDGSYFTKEQMTFLPVEKSYKVSLLTG